MDQQQYMVQRVEDQISWYDKKSRWNQKWYKRLRMLEITVAVLIPLFAGLLSISNIYTKLLIGISGVIVAVVASTLNLYKFQENWIEYRATTEMLRHEKYLYLTHSGPDAEKVSFSTFVERIESLISKENTNWAQYIKNEDKKEKKDS